ncbi:MAG: nucleotidyltransferase family protein [Acidobacteria bacterium]|nr:nucleotidyltransferase family protein [Acidobacteriota bacterium]
MLSVDDKWNSLSEEVRLSRLLKAVKAISSIFERNWVLIKGESAARFYPSGHFRYYSDFDIVVDEYFSRSLSSADRMLLRTANIDLHFGLRHLDSLPWENFLERCEETNVRGDRIRLPCPEDHLRIMAVHWLTDGGEYKERLWDIYYAVANRPAEFDWNKCLDVVSPTRRKWVITTIGLAHKYLGLEIDDLPFAEEAKQIPQWIIDTVEREWARDLRLIPLRVSYRDPKKLVQQIRKRLPPNPITATIDMEGEFDDRSRVWYQLGSIAKRIPPGVKRFVDLAKARLGRKNADQPR